ncbi:YigZ family protein [Lacticaseibacillus sp. N501-2]|uniref:YigZ family protein n=1 Tax=Lacticaseibacillus salsurae TaxID=3367729 RepID=UPI0038B24A66
MVYRTIQTNGEAELIIKKSRFITQLARIHSEADAQAFITQVKKTHYKANHNVPVYLLGETDHIQRANDDGEPSGTAGVPMLKTLQEMGLHDVCAVTTRYFGGIKLGAGGLIRAYANSVVNAVNHVGIVERRMQTQVTIAISYSQLGSVQHFLEAQHLPMTITYAVGVEIKTSVPQPALKALQNDLTDLLSGQLSMTIGDDEFIEIPVTTTKNADSQ